jgi:outer membrane protein assembly factor BamB
MGGLNRIWRPVLPDGRRLEASSLDIDESGRVFILDGNVRVIYVFDRLGNLLLDMSGSMRDMRYKGPGDIRVAEGVVYLTEGRTGRVLALSLPRELRN